MRIDAHGGGGGEGGGGGAPHAPPINIFEKLLHKNAIKHDPPHDFLTTPSTPLKRICQENPRTPPLDFQLLCIYEFEFLTIDMTFENAKNVLKDLSERSTS